MLLARAHLHTTSLLEPASPEITLQALVGHDWVCAGVRLKGGATVLGAVDLTCQVGTKGENASKLISLRNFLSNTGAPFILMGDWNLPPEVLAETSFLSDLNTTSLTPDGAEITCRQGAGTFIDYMVVSTPLGGIISNNVLDIEGLGPPTPALVSIPSQPQIGA